MHKRAAGSFADKQRGSRHERGYGTAWDKTRARIMKRDTGLCQPSLRHGMVVMAIAVDHIIPKARGGSDDDDNLQAISAAVHAAKTAAEGRGAVWDEAGHFAERGRGVQMSTAHPSRTEPLVKFFRAQVLEDFSGVTGGR